MDLNTAIEVAVEEAIGCKVGVKVVKNPRAGEWKYFPCRREWLDGAGEGYQIVAEISASGNVTISTK